MVKRQSGHRVVLLLFFLLQAMLLGGRASAATHQTRVLVLHSTRQDTQLALLADRDLPRILTNRLGRPVDYYAEYMDAARIPDAQHQRALRDFLYRKYRGQSFDLVIAMEDAAWQFVRTHGDKLFPGTPIVFTSTDRNVQRRRNATGVISRVDLSTTLDLALKLQPEVSRVFVVSGASSRDKFYENLARTQLRSFERRVTFTYLAGLRRADLERRVAKLPERSIVYYLLVYQDGNGENLNPLDFLDRLTALANRPTYSWVDSTMNHGVVGGRLRDQSALVQAVAEKSVRVLRGERPNVIPVSTNDLNVAQLDWRQLQRWHISESLVPSGTRISYRQPEPSNRDSGYSLATVLPVSLLIALVAGLVIQRWRRRHAPSNGFGSVIEAARIEARTRHLSRRLLEAQEAEWARIALELHDDISQQAALVAINLQRAMDSARGRQKRTRQLVREALLCAKSLSRSAHDLSHQLHPATLRLVGLVGALAQLQRDLSRPGVAITVSAENVAPTLPDDIALCLFRVAQEALHNAIKHSGSRNIKVHLTGGNEQLMLTIADDGRGFDVAVATGKGLGLLSMNERVDAVGGTLNVVSRQGAGTRLDVSVPFTAPQAATMYAS
jgi:signal transduction histidine kinase